MSTPSWITTAASEVMFLVWGNTVEILAINFDFNILWWVKQAHYRGTVVRAWWKCCDFQNILPLKLVLAIMNLRWNIKRALINFEKQVHLSSYEDILYILYYMSIAPHLWHSIEHRFNYYLLFYLFKTRCRGKFIIQRMDPTKLKTHLY